MTPTTRPWTFYDTTVAVCSTCLRKVDGKVVFQDGRVLLRKYCPEHGAERVLLADDIDYWRRAREQCIKPSEVPRRFATETRFGCPYDCGLCPDHEQHSCVSVVELTDHCNLRCPVCYAQSGPHRKGFRDLETIEHMLDAVVAAEGEPDVVQLSGGEPTLHPDFFRILELARARPIRHLMLNTNGVRIAEEDGFAERLAEHAQGFEVYLQFDSLEEQALRTLRGADLREVRAKALERLDVLDLSTTLVVTLARGVNEHEIGALVDFALTHRCVRGVTFQPMQSAGRVPASQSTGPSERLTLTEVRRLLLEQSRVFQPADILPVPCHPECIAMAYALKTDEGVTPLTGMIDPQVLLDGARSTISFERDAELHARLVTAFSASQSLPKSIESLRQLLCCLPQVSTPEGLGYRNLFRVVIMRFLDAHDLELRTVKKSCVHVIHPDGRSIPMDTYNLFYRDGLESSVLAPLREVTAR